MKQLVSRITRAFLFPQRVFSPLIGFILLCLAGCGDTAPKVDMRDIVRESASDSGSDDRMALRVAVGAMISPETTREYYNDLIRVVAARIGRRAVFSQRRTYAEVNTLVATREVEVAFVCSGPYVEGHDQFGMELLAVPQAHGQTVYHSYIIVHHDAPFNSLRDLRGKRFAFTDPNSNTGCLVPTYMLAQQGETPESFFGEVFYSNSHDNSIQAVADGLADGAAVDSLVWEFINTVRSSLTLQTRVVEKSPPYGIPPVVVHPDLSPELKAELRNAFLTLHEDERAAALLQRVQIDKFVEGTDSMYDTVREMQRFLKERSNANQ